MEEKEKIKKRMVRQVFFRFMLPLILFTLITREWGEMELTWNYTALFSIMFIVGIGIAYIASKVYVKHLYRKGYRSWGKDMEKERETRGNN